MKFLIDFLIGLPHTTQRFSDTDIDTENRLGGNIGKLEHISSGSDLDPGGVVLISARALLSRYVNLFLNKNSKKGSACFCSIIEDKNI